MVRYMPKQEKGAFLVPTEKLTSMVERAKQGDELAKSEIYATFEGYLVRYFAKKIPAQDIPDRVQNTFTHVYRNINKVKKPAAFTTWMRTIARREIYHYYKKIERAQAKEEKKCGSLFMQKNKIPRKVYSKGCWPLNSLKIESPPEIRFRVFSSAMFIKDISLEPARRFP